MPMEAELMSVSPAQTAKPGMPGAHVLGHQLRDEARLVDDVVAGHLALGPRQPVDGLGGAGHARVVQQQDARHARAPRRGSKLGEGRTAPTSALSGLPHQSPRSLAIVS